MVKLRVRKGKKRKRLGVQWQFQKKILQDVFYNLEQNGIGIKICWEASW